MLGVFRFLLALSVMVSHYPYNGMSLNVGVMSVIAFYLISGYLMQCSYLRFQNFSSTPIRSFYIDRALKLLPLYWLVLILTYLAIVLLGKADVLDIMNQPLSIEAIAMNFLLLPVNYVFEPLIIDSILPHPAIPPAWSLATEAHFYLLLPFLVSFPRWALIGIAFLSLSLQLTAIFMRFEWITADGFGYRFIAGVLIFFLMGVLLARKDMIVTGFYGVFAMALLLIQIQPEWRQAWALEQWLGLLLFLPIIYLLLRFKPQSDILRSLDRQIGQLAYPLFIVHFLMFYVWEQLGLNVESTEYWIISMSSSIFLALCLAYVQKCFEARRFQRRGFNTMQSTLS